MNILILVSLNSCLNYLKLNKTYSLGYNQLNSSQFIAVDTEPVWFSNYLQFCLWKKCSENTAYSSAACNSRFMLKMKVNSWNNHKSHCCLENTLHSERLQEHIAHLSSQRDSLNWWLIWSWWTLQHLSRGHILMTNPSIELSGNKTSSKCSKLMTEKLHGIQVTSVQMQTSKILLSLQGRDSYEHFHHTTFFHLR